MGRKKDSEVLQMTNQMPERIYAWMGMQDNGSWDNHPCPCTSHDSVEYIRADLAQKTVTMEELERIVRYGHEPDMPITSTINALIKSGIVKVSD